MTFLSLPFLSRGRNTFVVWIGPRTLVAKEAVRSALKLSGDGLWRASGLIEYPMIDLGAYKSIRVQK